VPIRIYALAKELKLDSKSLVEICEKAGVSGKGSALASLSDEEMATVKAYLNRGKGAASPKAAATAETEPRTIRREDYIAPSGAVKGKVPVLPSSKPEKPPVAKKPAKKPPVVDEPAPEPTVAEPVAEAPAPPVVEPPVDELPPLTRPEPKPLSAKPPVVTSPPSKMAQKVREKRDRDKRTGPTIKLAPMPTAPEPPAKKAASKEPAPQKPDIKLPLDAIRAGKAGTKPLAEHLKKQEKKAAAKKVSSRKAAGPKKEGADAAEPLPTRERSRRGRGATTPADRDSTTIGGREQRQLKRKRAATARHGGGRDEETTTPNRRRTRIRRTGANTAAPRKTSVTIELPCSVRSFSESLGLPASTVLGKLMGLGTLANINANLDPELAEMLAVELGVDVNFQQPQSLEEELLEAISREDDPASLKNRPPIVTFLGHVDHGKTSLLDRIIGIDVVSGEKGGITQHIRAYRIEKEGRSIAFVDTPGHEAFTEMRARGANVTDIAVVVVAADDGIMPQTEEAISHARAAGVPIVVALNKIDLPGVDVPRIYQELAANELLPSEWGGDTEVIKTSATTGEGIDDLLETLLTVAELHEYQANPDRPGLGTCLEAELHEGRGVVAKLLVRNGTLRVGDVVVCGPGYGRIKALYDTLNPYQKYEEVGPSTPVHATGLHMAPGAGDRFAVMDDVSKARELAEQRATANRQRELAGAVRPHVTLENLLERLEEDEIQTLSIILRADVRGSIEAIRKELTKLEHPEIQIKILQATVGGVTEADIHLADASDAVIIAFNVVPDEGARSLAEQRGVQVRRYDIIYQVTEDLKAAMEGMLKPEKQERDLGRALVQRTFTISRVGTVAGCRVLAGNIERDARVRVIRDSRVIGDYRLDSLKREKDDAREVREGLECGMKLSGFNDLKEGDILEAYKVEEVARTF